MPLPTFGGPLLLPLTLPLLLLDFPPELPELLPELGALPPELPPDETPLLLGCDPLLLGVPVAVPVGAPLGAGLPELVPPEGLPATFEDWVAFPPVVPVGFVLHIDDELGALEQAKSQVPPAIAAITHVGAIHPIFLIVASSDRELRASVLRAGH